MTILNININDFGGINHHMEEFKNKYGKDGILVDGMLGINRPTVYELLKKNEFRWIQIGNKYRISKKVLDEWLDQKSKLYNLPSK